MSLNIICYFKKIYTAKSTNFEKFTMDSILHLLWRVVILCYPGISLFLFFP